MNIPKVEQTFKMQAIPKVELMVVIENNLHATISVEDSRMIIESSLYRERIPVELRNIIGLYYGEESVAEHLIYPMAVKQVHSMMVNKPGLSLSPIDLSVYDFTSEINYYFKFAMCRIGRGYVLTPINPAMFYEYYLKEHPDTDVPKRNENSFPRLPVPRYISYI